MGFNRYILLLISVNVLYNIGIKTTISIDTEDIMLQPKHKSFLNKTFSGIQLQADLVVLDPYDSDYQTHINNVKHGAWIGESAYFSDDFSKRSLLVSAEVYKCAQLLANRANTNDEYKSLVEIFKRQFGRKETIQQAQTHHLDNHLVSDCFKIVADYLEPLRNELTVSDSVIDFDNQMNMIFHDAVHALKGEHSQEEEDWFKRLLVNVSAKSEAEAEEVIQQQFLNKILPEAIERFKVQEDKNRIAIEDRFPRSVQYVRMKHSDQAEYTALDSTLWENHGAFENGSGQLGIIALDHLETTTEKELQMTLSEIANDIQLIDGERVNMSMVGAYEHGMNCMTPLREAFGDVWVIRNANAEIIEVMIHFDLKE